MINNLDVAKLLLQVAQVLGDNLLTITILSLVLAPWGAMAIIAYALSLLKGQERRR